MEREPNSGLFGNIGNKPKLKPAVMPNIPNMPNLRGIGGIPGLQNIDFSNLLQGLNPSMFGQASVMPQAPTGQITDMLMRNPDGSPMLGNLLPKIPPPSQGGPIIGLNPPLGGFEGSLPVQQAPVQQPLPVQQAPVQQPLAPYTGGNDRAP